MITVENISRKYGDFLAVDDVSFTIPKGQILGLLGHNGAGKTTIMKLLTGFLEPNSGKVIIDGINIDDDLKAIQKRIGYLPENVPLYHEMNVVDYLEYVAELKDVPREERKDKISAAISKTALTEKALDKIETLSKGFKQRVGVAQAILNNPEILILDEPTNGLDPSQIQDMRNLIKELAENSTVILSTHIMQEVEAICERVLIIQQGKLALDESLDEIKSGGGVILSVDRDSNEVAHVLNRMKGVKNYNLLSQQDGIYSYLLKPNKGQNGNFLPEIASKVVSEGWKLYALSPREQSLEAVFRSINSN